MQKLFGGGCPRDRARCKKFFGLTFRAKARDAKVVPKIQRGFGN
jgi:hypothetical protein